MSGCHSGVQKKVQEIVGNNYIYIHCYAHWLNLVVVNAASTIKDVRNVFGLLEAVYCFLTASTLRHDKFVDLQKQEKLNIMEIPKLSDTRWVCRYVAVKV